MFKKFILLLGGVILMSQTPPATAADDANTLIIELSTGGPVVIEMKPDVAPNHVERIKTLAKQGFYDGIVFHRVIDGFMAQTGDPTGTGMGGSDLPDLKAEFNPTHHGRGSVSMARTNDPNTANSQFFICFKDCGFLDNQYTVWGQVTKGMEHVDAIARGEPPANPDKIVSMKVMEDVQENPATAKAPKMMEDAQVEQTMETAKEETKEVVKDVVEDAHNDVDAIEPAAAEAH